MENKVENKDLTADEEKLMIGKAVCPNCGAEVNYVIVTEDMVDNIETEKARICNNLNLENTNETLNQTNNSALHKTDVSRSFPDNVEIWKWWKTQNFQKEQSEQEYTMIYEIDLPKILKAFTEYLRIDAVSNSEVLNI